MCFVYMSYAFHKWITIFKCNSSITITTCCCYIPYYKNICFLIITKIWFNGFGFKFNDCTIFISIAIVSYSDHWYVILLTFDIDMYLFLVANFEDSLSASTNKFTIFWVFIFICSQNQTTVAAFCENSEVVSSDLSVIKTLLLLHFL